MDKDDNPKLRKPLSALTLEQELADYPELYKKIADTCIFAMTGLDQQQRREAINLLLEYIPEGQSVYVASRVARLNGNIREIAWTFDGAACWQLVIRIPAAFRTTMLFGEMLYISMQ